MKSCPSCGGVIGRDCFNPVECAWITQQINNEYTVDDFVAKMNSDHERRRQDEAEREYSAHIEAEIADYELTQILESSTILNRFLMTI